MKSVTCSLLALGGLLIAGLGGQHLSSLLYAQEANKGLVWKHGLNFKVRKVGEKEFSDKTKKFSLEVRRDENTKQLIYITDTGSIAVVDARDSTKPSEVKAPTWWYAFWIKVRQPDEKKFTQDTKAYGIE